MLCSQTHRRLAWALAAGLFTAAAQAEGDDKGDEGFAAPKSHAAQDLLQKVACEALPQKTEEEMWTRAECHFKRGDHLAASEILRELTRKNPRDLEAYFTASWLLWSHGRIVGGNDEHKSTMSALEELQRARLANPLHWEVDTEIGDFFFLRLNQPEKAYPEYILARSHYEGDYAHGVPKADMARRASIENRIARTAEKLDRRGEAIDASCRALYFDPDDSSAKGRIDRLFGNCVKKQTSDPTKPPEEKGHKREGGEAKSKHPTES